MQLVNKLPEVGKTRERGTPWKSQSQGVGVLKIDPKDRLGLSESTFRSVC